LALLSNISLGCKGILATKKKVFMTPKAGRKQQPTLFGGFRAVQNLIKIFGQIIQDLAY